MVDEKFYSLYLEEMHELENFRLTYAAAHSSIPLQEEEPDVKRLIEALAFFNARSRRAALDNVLAVRQRILQQHYPYLLKPVPAMAMLEANPTARFAEPVQLPAGTRMAIRSASSKIALFTTLEDLELFPMQLNSVIHHTRANGAIRVSLGFQTPYPRNDHLAQLNLAINYLNNYFTSLRFMSLLNGHLRAVSISYEKQVNEETEGQPCQFSLGGKENGDDFVNPVEKVRRFFHFPRNELKLSIEIPRPPRNWEQFHIMLDLDQGWPKGMNFHRETFRLFAVPAVNLVRGDGQPVACKGLRERYMISHPEPEFGFSVHSIRGVSRASDAGTVPLRPGILRGGNGSYEVEYQYSPDGKEKTWVAVDLPDAFDEESILIADANWYQPWFAEQIGKRLFVSPYSRTVPGISWEVCGNIVPHVDNHLIDDPDAFVQILSMKNKARFNLDDIRFILTMLGSVETGPFKDIAKLLRGVHVSEGSIRQEKSLAPAMIYRLDFRDYDTSLEPVVTVFREMLQEFLNAWSTEASTKVV